MKPDDAAPGVAGTLKTPFDEAIAFFRQKLNLPSERWDDIWQAAHDRAFIVAGAQKADLLGDLFSAVDRSIAEGKSIGWFRKEFDRIVQKHGWTGWTGDGTKAGRAWRTQVIQRTNVMAAHAAGRWQQLNDPDLVKLRPYWQYIHADGVIHPRPLHVSWHGLTLPREHPFWRTHFPPNGWGCHCRVKAVGKREYDAAVKNGRGPDAAPAEGDTTGIDPGWAYAPGANRMTPLRELVDLKKLNLPPELANALENEVSTIVSQLPPPNEPTFIPARSVHEAEQWVIKNDLADHADYTGVKVEVANAWNESLFDHLQEFPELRQRQKFVGTCQAQFARWREIEIQHLITRLQAANPHLPNHDFRPQAERMIKPHKVDGRTWAHSWAQQNVSGIAVNKKWGGNVDTFKASLAENVKSKWHPIGCDTIRSVVDHEMAHQLDDLLGLHIDPEVITLYNEARAKGIREEVSTYAGTNIKEFIAECWAEACNNVTPRPFAAQLAALIRRRYQDQHPRVHT